MFFLKSSYRLDDQTHDQGCRSICIQHLKFTRVIIRSSQSAFIINTDLTFELIIAIESQNRNANLRSREAPTNPIRSMLEYVGSSRCMARAAMVNDQAISIYERPGGERTFFKFTKWPEKNHRPCEFMDAGDVNLKKYRCIRKSVLTTHTMSPYPWFHRRRERFYREN
jgi:hypothetical protein